MALKGSHGKAPTHGRRFTDMAESFDSSVGAGSRIKGEIRGETNVEINGAFEGELEIKGFLWLRPGGSASGTVKATDIVVEGEMRGSLVASNRVDLRETCKVTGDITATALTVAEGSFFEGKISMKGGGSTSQVVSYQEKRTGQ